MPFGLNEIAALPADFLIISLDLVSR